MIPGAEGAYTLKKHNFIYSTSWPIKEEVIDTSNTQRGLIETDHQSQKIKKNQVVDEWTSHQANKKDSKLSGQNRH